MGDFGGGHKAELDAGLVEEVVFSAGGVELIFGVLEGIFFFLEEFGEAVHFAFYLGQEGRLFEFDEELVGFVEVFFAPVCLVQEVLGLGQHFCLFGIGEHFSIAFEAFGVGYI